MMLGKTLMVRVCLILISVVFMAIIPAYGQGQRGRIGIDFGQTSDKFGALPQATAAVGDVNGELVVLRAKAKGESPDVVAGGEIRFPFNTTNHANEFSVFGGVMFHFKSSFTAGFHVQVHKLIVPPSIIDNQTFNRNNMELLEIPLVVEYKFGPGKHVFLEAQGAPEFSPRFRTSRSGPTGIPNANFDYGYFIRGSLGYNFAKWYARGTYETRYFKFNPGLGNPSNLYNWRTNFATAGVGLVF
jgi:hypothetical protein